MTTKSANQKKQTLHKASAFCIIQFVVWAADCIIFQTDSMLWRI